MPFERDNLLDALVAAESALDKLAEELVKAAAAELTGPRSWTSSAMTSR
jgi:hypothetical protein